MFLVASVLTGLLPCGLYTDGSVKNSDVGESAFKFFAVQVGVTFFSAFYT